MTELTQPIRSYIAAFERLEQGLNGTSDSAIHQVRRNAIQRFAEMGFPTTRQEEWKYTSVAAIAGRSFTMAEVYQPGGLSGKEFERIERGLFGEPPDNRLVFVDGRHAADLSALGDLPAGVVVRSLADVLQTDSGLVEGMLGRYVGAEDHAFAVLNTAFAQEGAVVQIPSGQVVEAPIHLLFISTGRADGVVSYPRVLVTAGESSQAALVESYIGLGDAVSLTDAVVEVVLAENASIDHYKLQEESLAAYHVSMMHVHQERNSRFVSHSISLGGALARNDVRVELGGEGIETTLNGLYIATGQQHVDNHTLIDHASPHCDSREVYHGILDGRARGVFNGKILVRQDAQKTDARQTNRNLLISDTAQVDTKPQLEIFADDVKCTHGATVGQLDEESVFYLRSRGIDLENARGLLTYAFASEIVAGIKLESLRDHLEKLVFSRLSSGAGNANLLTGPSPLKETA